MFLKIKKIFFFALLIITAVSNASVEDLLNMPTRPLMADVERELKKPNSIQADRASLHYVKYAAAEIIAELEWAYPGAIYMPLGRDTVGLGDIIDAFYRSQGQPGRVIRLDASGPSLEVDQSLIVEFIQSSGVDIKNLAKGPSYVFFDASNYFLPDRSQSTKILSAVYAEYVRQGGKAEDILEKFAFFNISSSEPHIAVKPGLNRQDLLSKQYKYLQENPGRIPEVTFTSSIYSCVQSEWHPSFGPLIRHSDGSVRAEVPSPHSLSVRWGVLRQMAGIIEAVREESFLHHLRNHAKSLGYEFKLQNCDSALIKGS